MPEAILNIKLLKDQVYDFLKDQIRRQYYKPGSTINLDKTSKELGISRTPLRDALLQLEVEGFVTITPRHGIFVNTLTERDIENYYQVIGTLENEVIISCRHLITETVLEKMEMLIKGMWEAFEKKDSTMILTKNELFHSAYLSLTGNAYLLKTVDALKKRLYDFQAKDTHPWELIPYSIKEHETIVELMRDKRFVEAGQFVQHTHWSYKTQNQIAEKLYLLQKGPVTQEPHQFVPLKEMKTAV